MQTARLAASLLALAAPCALVGCLERLEPGFAPVTAPAGPALIATATLGDPGHADVTIEGRELGALFGLSFHVTATTNATTNATLSDARATDALALDRTVALLNEADDDAAFGGTRLDPAAGDAALDDGALATVHVQAREAGDVELRIERAVVRRADGSFVPVAVAGGTLTLEAAQ